MKQDWYTRLYLWLSAHRPLVFSVTLLITLAGLLLSARISLEEDILAVLPQNDRLVDEYRYTLRKFRQIDRVYLDVGIDRADPETLGRAADAVFGALTNQPAFVRVMYRMEMSGQRQVVDFLTGALPNLFTEADAQALAPKLEPAAVRAYLTAMRRKLAGPEGMVLKDVVAADPVGLSGLVLAKVLPLQTGFGDGAQIEDGRITSRDGRHVLLMAEPRFPSSNSSDSTELVAGLLRSAREVEQRFPGVRIALTGGHRMTVDNATLIKGDATRCILLGMVAMLALCLTAFRRRWLAVVAFLPSLFGTLIAGVIISYIWPHLSAISLGFATIAIGITVDYAIYVIYQLDNAAGLDHASIGRRVGALVLPLGAGSLTTIAAFVVMAYSPMRGYQQLGVFGAVGVLISAAFALVILPLLVPIPKRKDHPPLWLTGLMARFFAWRSRRLSWLLLGVAVLSLATIGGVRRLRFEGDITKFNGITESTRRDEELIRGIWGDGLGMTLVVSRGATLEEALAGNDRAAGILARQPGVSGISSTSAVLPSQATQETNARRWGAFWTPARRAALHQTLQQVGGELGFRPEAFAAFWKMAEGVPAPITAESFRHSPMEQVLSERLASGAGDYAVTTLLKVDDRSQLDGLRQALPGLIVIDKKAFAEHIANLAKQGLLSSSLWITLLVAFILYFSLGAIELVLATLLPMIFGLLWTFGLMGWLGLPVDMMNSVFVIFVIGVCEDYSVFLVTCQLDEWRGHPQQLAVTSASMLISALTTIFGFAVLVFAQHPVLYSMGTTVLLGITSSFLATVVLTPLCAKLVLFKDPPRGAPRAWHVLGALWFGLHLGAAEVLLYAVLRPVLKLVGPRTADDRLRRATRWMARGAVKGFPYGRLEYQQITPATFDPPCILISNHQSAVDVMLMVTLPADVRQTAKKRVFDTPILGIGCKLLGHVLVEPNDPATTLRRCREKLAEGASVHFYPEGTRSQDGFVQRFHRGAFELAVELNQDLLPVVLCDTHTAMPRDSFWIEPYRVTVRALPRITPKNFDYRLGSTALMRHAEAVVRAGLQEQLDAINTPAVVRRKVERLYRYQGKFTEQFVHWKLKLDPMFPALDALVPRQGVVLDLGCGYGLATHWLAQFTDTRTFLGVDYDENKIRVAQRTAAGHRRIRFEARDLLDWIYPPCDAVLLLDVLHYWTADKQQRILDQACRALRPGGRLILRDAARDEGPGHERVTRWEKFATRIGHNKTEEGLHFQGLDELTAMVRRAGFTRWEIRRDAGRDSNVLLLAWVEGPPSAGAQTP